MVFHPIHPTTWSRSRRSLATAIRNGTGATVKIVIGATVETGTGIETVIVIGIATTIVETWGAGKADFLRMINAASTMPTNTGSTNAGKVTGKACPNKRKQCRTL